MVWVWVVIALAVIAAVVLAVTRARSHRRRTHELQQGFGPEYERAVAEHGDRRAAEEELLERQKRHAGFELRPLDDETQTAYAREWLAAQGRFVDEPSAAVAAAGQLITRVMRDRGYPVDDSPEQRAADLSVEHANVIENYRVAHSISTRARDGQASTEELRQAMIHFRALFGDLLDDHPTGDPKDTTADARA